MTRFREGNLNRKDQNLQSGTTVQNNWPSITVKKVHDFTCTTTNSFNHRKGWEVRLVSPTRGGKADLGPDSTQT